MVVVSALERVQYSLLGLLSGQVLKYSSLHLCYAAVVSLPLAQVLQNSNYCVEKYYVGSSTV